MVCKVGEVLEVLRIIPVVGSYRVPLSVGNGAQIHIPIFPGLWTCPPDFVPGADQHDHGFVERHEHLAQGGGVGAYEHVHRRHFGVISVTVVELSPQFERTGGEVYSIAPCNHSQILFTRIGQIAVT